jgi:regulator of sigma E protease
MGITAAILGLAVLILIHEAGHFVAARAVGMRPRKFYLGFGPPIVKTTRGGVEYGIGSIPLGGYVKIPGMHRPAPGDLRKTLRPEEQQEVAAELDALDAALERGDEETARAQLPKLEPALKKNRFFQELEGSLATDAYWRQTAWKRIVVIAAGPLTNVVLAAALFAAVFMLGSTQATTTVGALEPGMPAVAAGLKAGDTIVAVDGRPVVEPEDVPIAIRATEGRPFTLVVRRSGERMTLGPLEARRTEGVYRIGFRLSGVQGPGQSLPEASWSAMRVIGEITVETVKAIGAIATGERTEEISSVVGITRVTSDAFRESARDFIAVIGYVSLALALLNLLPVLPLDGGHIVMSILERLRGRAFSQLVYMRYSAVGLMLFVFLLYLGLRNDLFSSGS